MKCCSFLSSSHFVVFARAGDAGRLTAASLGVWSLISFPVFHQELRVKGSLGVLFCLLLARRDVCPPSFSRQELNHHRGVQPSPTMQSHKWGQFEKAPCVFETSSKFSRKAVEVPLSSNTKRGWILWVCERGHFVPYGKGQRFSVKSGFDYYYQNTDQFLIGHNVGGK